VKFWNPGLVPQSTLVHDLDLLTQIDETGASVFQEFLSTLHTTRKSSLGEIGDKVVLW
jgi:hypothetical protein